MNTTSQKISDSTLSLSEKGYWPARAARFVSEGLYSRAVEVCLEKLPDDSELISGHLIYAVALYKAGQTESAAEQFYEVLSRDPDNLVALKYLGDIKYATGDVFAALADYNRILEIDPGCRGLKCELSFKNRETTRSITITRGEEIGEPSPSRSLRDIPFYTETLADLYLAQGHARLAAEVYDYLSKIGDNPRLQNKLSQARNKVKDKE
ncbi:MAG: tetratricopeptide repeat protein [candidate division Zixibacteria bacterium]|nr:tetratricopeptide repeat protein [candidate division Zixibacteria bacterium]